MKHSLITLLLLSSPVLAQTRLDLTRVDRRPVEWSLFTNAIISRLHKTEPLKIEDPQGGVTKARPTRAEDAKISHVGSSLSSATAFALSELYHELAPGASAKRTAAHAASAQDLDAVGYFPETATALARSIQDATTRYRIGADIEPGEKDCMLMGQFAFQASGDFVDALEPQDPFIDAPLLYMECGANWLEVFHVGDGEFWILGELIYPDGQLVPIFETNWDGNYFAVAIREEVAEGQEIAVAATMNSATSVSRGGPPSADDPGSADGERSASWLFSARVQINSVTKPDDF